MKSILSAINAIRKQKSDAVQSDAERFKHLIGKASTSKGELPAGEAAELVSVAERLGYTPDDLEAKVADAIAARAKFDELLPKLRSRPAIQKRIEQTLAAHTSATEHHKKAVAEAEAALAKTSAAYGEALREDSAILDLGIDLGRLYQSSGAYLPTPTSEINYLMSHDFQVSKPANRDVDYTDPKNRAVDVKSSERLTPVVI